ncbi:hypothetical protein Kirov_112 [Bacillus phage Kirov]|uniref:Uncharacterized protein n=1 Tax=Bacillus phage Kirov TaxID=2783539 RepID=A0A7U3NJV1_9CAUD|nr:hypothetical protein PQE67_gp192 [Bacillus phage Kirov]QOV08311.1 hypothetical protein Kirov_112 [Bacillus phage Kirov]
MYALKVKGYSDYFLNPTYWSWSFTKDSDKATKFETLEEANDMKETIERAVASTFWDYDEDPPFPVVIKV